MDWQTAGNIAQVATGVAIPCGLLGLYVRYVVAENNEHLKDWINGSFMRAKVVEAKLDAIDSRLDEHSRRFEAWDRG